MPQTPKAPRSTIHSPRGLLAVGVPFTKLRVVACEFTRRSVIWALNNVAPGVHATPVNYHNSISPGGSANSPRIFNILADGTQDLAALVGLFTTDSVERYSVDYCRGYLSVAVATCSLLGILGYVRALIKLAMGLDLCEASAFPTYPIRAILGVANSDRVPKDELTAIIYVKKQLVEPSEVRYSVQARKFHTAESSPLTHTVNPQDMYGNHGFMRFNERFRHRTRFIVWSCLLFTAGATSFPVLAIIPRASWTWIELVASFGLFIGLSVSAILWSIVYMKEQYPNSEDPYSGKLSEFAVVCPEALAGHQKLALCSIGTFAGAQWVVCRAVSLAMGFLICFGYICQYLAIKNASARLAGIWLGTQTGLSILRIVVWICDPKFDNHADYKFEHIYLSRNTEEVPERNRFYRHNFDFRMQGEYLASIFFKSFLEELLGDSAIQFPERMLGRLKTESLIRLFEGAYTLLSGTDGGLAGARLGLFDNCRIAWRFPQDLFTQWLHSLADDNLRTRVANHNIAYGALLMHRNLDLRSDSWGGGEILLIPYIRPNYPGYDHENRLFIGFKGGDVSRWVRFRFPEGHSRPTEIQHLHEGNGEELRGVDLEKCMENLRKLVQYLERVIQTVRANRLQHNSDVAFYDE